MMKLKPSLTLDAASTIMDTALSHGRDENLLPLTVVVLDAGGKMIASKSEDGSGIMGLILPAARRGGRLAWVCLAARSVTACLPALH